jgi:acylphosphatase
MSEQDPTNEGSSPDEKQLGRRYLVQGRVQGVGYRYFVAHEAEALGLDGWVRNLFDGRVELLGYGDAVTLDTLEGRLWQGPPMARVTGIEVFDADAPDWRGFRILFSST